MAVLTLSLRAEDKASNTIQNVSKNFVGLGNNVEIAKKSLEKVQTASKGTTNNFFNITAGIGGIITIINTAINLFKKFEIAMKQIGAGNEINELKKVFETIGKLIADLVIPAVRLMATGITNFIKSANGLATISSIVASISATFTFLKEVFVSIANVLKDVVIAQVEKIKSSFSNFTSESENVTRSLDVVKGIFVVVGAVIGGVTRIVGTQIQAFIDLANVVMQVGDLLGKIFTGQWDKVGEAAAKSWEKVKNFGKNFAENFVGIIKGASEDANKLNENIKIEEIAEKTKKSFESAKENAKNSLISIEKNNEEVNKNILADNLVFTNELKKQYDEYVKIKQDLIDKNYNSEQEYFEKLNKLKELEKVKGIKELEDYYNKRENIVTKGLENEKNLFKGLQDFANQLQKTGEVFITDLGNAISNLINNVLKNISSMTSSIVSAINSIKEKLKEIEDNSNLTELQKNIEKIKIAFKGVGEIVAETFKSIAGIVAGAIGYYTNDIENNIKNIERSYENLFKKIEKQRDKELENLEKEYTEKENLLKTGYATELEYEEAKLQELLDLKNNFKDEELAMREEALQEYFDSLDNKQDRDIQETYNYALLQMQKQQQKQQADIQEQISEQQKTIALIKLKEEKEKKEAEIKKKYEEQKAKAEKQRQAEINEQKARIFEANKSNQIANVWIQTGIGLATAWAGAMQLGPIAGPIAGAILTTLLLTNAGVQTGLIASQNYVQEMATGGRMTETGYALVGETGRELVKLPAGAEVINNDRTERLLEEKEINIINQIFLDTDLIAEKLLKVRRSNYLSYLT